MTRPCSAKACTPCSPCSPTCRWWERLAMGRRRCTWRLSSPLIEPFSERELEILRLLGQGASNKEIADHLVITVGTVKNHLTSILGKLGVRDRTQAALKARELGII